jgi:hypothetical protein
MRVRLALSLSREIDEDDGNRAWGYAARSGEGTRVSSELATPDAQNFD